MGHDEAGEWLHPAHYDLHVVCGLIAIIDCLAHHSVLLLAIPVQTGGGLQVAQSDTPA